MGTLATPPSSGQRKPLKLKVVIEGLQFLAVLSEASPKDPRIPDLVKTLKEDVIEALAAIHSGDDVGKSKVPDDEA